MARIKGTVAKGGAPLERAYVRCVGPSGEFVAEEYTGADGAFLFHVADGSWTLEVRAADTPTLTRVVEAHGDADVEADLNVG